MHTETEVVGTGEEAVTVSRERRKSIHTRSQLPILLVGNKADLVSHFVLELYIYNPNEKQAILRLRLITILHSNGRMDEWIELQPSNHAVPVSITLPGHFVQCPVTIATGQPVPCEGNLVVIWVAVENDLE